MELQQSLINLSIGEVAQRVGMRTSALRYYESVGLLPNPERSGGQRKYDEGVLQRIRFIQAAQKTGFSIKEIKVLLGENDSEKTYSQRLQVLAKQKLEEVEALIASALAMKRVLQAAEDCRCENPQDCILFMKEDL